MSSQLCFRFTYIFTVPTLIESPISTPDASPWESPIGSPTGYDSAISCDSGYDSGSAAGCSDTSILEEFSHYWDHLDGNNQPDEIEEQHQTPQVFRLSLGRHIMCVATMLVSALLIGNFLIFRVSRSLLMLCTEVHCCKVVTARDTVGSAVAH